MKRRHHPQAAFFCELYCMLARSLKVFAMLDQLGAERAHGGILLAAVAVWHDDGRRHRATRGSEGNRLTMVAARRTDDTRGSVVRTRKLVEVNQATAHFESTERRVIFMFCPDLRAQRLAKQRPGILRRRLYCPMNDCTGALERLQRTEILAHIVCLLRAHRTVSSVANA